MAQITNQIINLRDAYNNLSPKQYDNVFKLFCDFKKCKTKMKLDIEGYYEVCLEIIEKFNKIAPYEKYSGGSELETSFLLDEINKLKKESEDEFDEAMYKVASDELNEELENYKKVILEGSKGFVDENDVEKFCDVIKKYLSDGKVSALKEFDSFSFYLKDKYNEMSSFQVSFFLGVLESNGIINKNEMERKRDDYTNKMIEEIKKNAKNNKINESKDE